MPYDVTHGYRQGPGVSRPETESPPEADKWANVVSAAEDHVRREATPGAVSPRPLPGQRVIIALACLTVAVLAALWAPRLVPREPAHLSSVEQAQDLRAEAGMLIREIENYKKEHGTLPQPAALAPFLGEGYEYQIINESTGKYVVRHSADGIEVTYDGSLPLRLWLVVGGMTSGGTK